MADAIALISIGVVTIFLGAKGFFGALFIVVGLFFLRMYAFKRMPKVKRVIPGKSLVVRVEGEERVRVVIPLALISSLIPMVSAVVPFLSLVPKDKLKIGEKSNLDLKDLVIPIISSLNDIMGILSGFEGDLVFVETDEERVRISVE